MRKPLTRGLSASQAHATMDLWASAKNWEDLTLLYTFEDGSELIETFPRATREATYKVDGEGTYTVDVPTNRFVCHVLGTHCKTAMIRAAKSYIENLGHKAVITEIRGDHESH